MAIVCSCLNLTSLYFINPQLYLIVSHTRTRTVADPAVEWGGGGKKHEIYAAAHQRPSFYDLFLQFGGGGMAPSPLDPLMQDYLLFYQNLQYNMK